MRLEVEWTFFLNVANPAKSRKVIQRIEETSRMRIEVIQIERYWKEKNTLRVLARSQFVTPSQGDALFTIMVAASGIASSWLVTGPKAEDGEWSIGGTSNPGSTAVQGLEAASFRARTAHIEADVDIEPLVIYAEGYGRPADWPVYVEHVQEPLPIAREA